MKCLVVLLFLFMNFAFAQPASLSQEKSRSSQQVGPGVSGGGSFMESEVYALAESVVKQIRIGQEVLGVQTGLDGEDIAKKLSQLKFQEWKADSLSPLDRTQPYHFVDTTTVEINVEAWEQSVESSKLRYILQMALQVSQLPINYKHLMALGAIAMPNLNFASNRPLLEQKAQILSIIGFQSPFAVVINDKNARVEIEFWTAYREVLKYACEVYDRPVLDLKVQMDRERQELEVHYSCYFQDGQSDISKKKRLFQSASLKIADLVLTSNSAVIRQDLLDVRGLSSRYRIQKHQDGRVVYMAEDELGYGLRRIKVTTHE